MPARHKKNRGRLAARRVKKSKPRVSKLVFILPIIGIFVVAVFFTFFATSFKNMDRVGLITPDGSGNVVFNLFDFKDKRLATVIIPGSTQVDVARRLGTWKMESVWQLGENQKIGGKLLMETSTKSLMMPAEYWGEGDYAKLSSMNLSDVLNSIFSFKSTNLNLADRVKLGLFSLQVGLADRSSVDLAKTKFLTRTKIQDGTLGYKVSGEDLPFELKAAFANDQISKESSTIVLENASGMGVVSGEVSSLIEIIGGKVATISKKTVDHELDCIVFGDSKSQTAVSIARIFSCKLEPRLATSNFDIVMRVGEKFGFRY